MTDSFTFLFLKGAVQAWLLGFWVCTLLVSGLQPGQPCVHLQRWRQTYSGQSNLSLVERNTQILKQALKKKLEAKTRLILPERELFLYQDASRLHLLSTSKTLLLPQLLCRTAAQTYATTCLGKTEGLSGRNGVRSLWCNHATSSSRNNPIAKLQKKPKVSISLIQSETN